MTLNKRKTIVFTIPCVVLYFIWTVLELIIVPIMESNIDTYIVDIIKEIPVKIVIWFVPALLLAVRFNEYSFVKKEELFSFHKGCIKFVLILFLFASIHLISAYLENGEIHVNESFRMTDAAIAISVGFSEEMVFRGWFLNITITEKRKWIPILLNALMFLIIHFPVWLKTGMFAMYFMSGAFIQIIVLSIIFGWCFVKSKSILVPAFLHAFWDFMCFIL